MLSKFELPSAKTIVSAAASAAATAMVIRSFARKFIPPELRRYLLNKIPLILTALTNDVTITIDEFDGFSRNKLFSAAELYIATIAGPSTKRLRASILEKEEQIHVSLGGNEDITDRFGGCHLKWRLVVSKTKTPTHRLSGSTVQSESRYLELSFHKKHKNTVVDEYLPYVLERSKAVKEEKKTLKLHTLKGDRVAGRPWVSVNLDHPSSFETLAMDGEMKSSIMDDLDMFVKRRELYRKVGKAWKRGYLLFGPPGTGKSSLVAAMANYLRFDVYDLELTSIWSNSDLRSVLLATANRSILVVEDIDASIDLPKRKGTQLAPPPATMNSKSRPKVTLSGLLNFIDGLWSTCGDERIIIFTTNHKDKLDPALLRPGRMDVHIEMSFCTPHGFKLLATNYLGPTTENNPLVIEAERLVASSKVTPAEVGEYLLRSDDPEIALKGLIKFLDHKKETGREKSAIGLKSGTNGLDLDRLKRLIKSATSAEISGKILEKDESANALKVLIGFFENEAGAGKTNVSNSSSIATGLESGKESGVKSN